jgi:hypothetical protein
LFSDGAQMVVVLPFAFSVDIYTVLLTVLFDKKLSQAHNNKASIHHELSSLSVEVVWSSLYEHQKKTKNFKKSSICRLNLIFI